jgi:hypothetical protein
MSAGQRPRTYDDATRRRWADAILAGISGREFHARFGLTLESARRRDMKTFFLGSPEPSWLALEWQAEVVARIERDGGWRAAA